MENRDYYFICFIILGIAFILIIGILVFFNLNKEEIDEEVFKITTKTTQDTTKSRLTTNDKPKDYGQASISTITMTDSKLTKTIDFTNDNDETYYISRNGYRELVLSTNETISKEEMTNSETSCIKVERLSNNRYSFKSNNCTEQDTISITLYKGNTSKRINIINETDLTLSYDGANIKDSTFKLKDSIIEFTSNVSVEWITSDKNGLIYTDLSSYNIQFKLVSNITIRAVTKGGQEKKISLML